LIGFVTALVEDVVDEGGIFVLTLVLAAAGDCVRGDAGRRDEGGDSEVAFLRQSFVGCS
jgi:hypothetical protein